MQSNNNNNNPIAEAEKPHAMSVEEDKIIVGQTAKQMSEQYGIALPQGSDLTEDDFEFAEQRIVRYVVENYLR